MRLYAKLIRHVKSPSIRERPSSHARWVWPHAGRGSGFSVEAPEGVRFLTRSRVFTDEEVAELEAAGPPARAA
jgi:hypothetical protein